MDFGTVSILNLSHVLIFNLGQDVIILRIHTVLQCRQARVKLNMGVILNLLEAFLFRV